MATLHKDIGEADLHEPKGASTASVDTVYVSNGAGSGTWAQAPYKAFLNVTISDLSTADTVYLPSPVAGTISKIYSVIKNSITTGDSTISFLIGATPVTNGDILVEYTGSAAGDIDSSTPSAANVLAVGDLISISTDGASNTTCQCNIIIVVDVG